MTSMSHSSDNPWREPLHARFRGQPIPLIVMQDALWTGASLWAGTRAWTKAFRAMGLGRGDVLACTLPAGPAFAQVLMACLWDEIAFMPVRARGAGALQADASVSDARVVIAESADVVATSLPVVAPDDAGQPPSRLPELPATSAARSGFALIAAAAADGPIHCHTAAQVVERTRRMAARQRLDGACVLSVMPWHLSNELIDGVLASLLHADELVVAADRSPTTSLLLVAEHPVTHLSLDDATAATWRTSADGAALLGRVAVRYW